MQVEIQLPKHKYNAVDRSSKRDGHYHAMPMEEFVLHESSQGIDICRNLVQYYKMMPFCTFSTDFLKVPDLMNAAFHLFVVGACGRYGDLRFRHVPLVVTKGRETF